MGNGLPLGLSNRGRRLWGSGDPSDRMWSPISHPWKENRMMAIRLWKAVVVGGALLLAIPAVSHAAAKTGKEIYTQVCSACHKDGIAGAPKVGDKAAWKERIGHGMPHLIEHATKGYQGKAGYMPPKGGNPSLSDKDVEAAVKHMVEQSK